MDSFAIVLSLLNDARPEVLGHSEWEPDPETRGELERFLAGGSTPERVSELCRKLSSHPEWIGWLAGEIRKRRPTGGNGVAV